MVLALMNLICMGQLNISGPLMWHSSQKIGVTCCICSQSISKFGLQLNSTERLTMGPWGLCGCSPQVCRPGQSLAVSAQYAGSLDEVEGIHIRLDQDIFIVAVYTPLTASP